MYDWFLAKKELTGSNAYQMPIDGLGDIAFYYDKDSDIDRIVIDHERNIRLNHASSGLRSSIPLLIVFNYIIKGIYNSKRAKTPFEIIDIEEKIKGISIGALKVSDDVKQRMLTLKSMIDDMADSLSRLQNKDDFQHILTNIQEQTANILGYYSDYFFSQVIIEEPELNLFPKTQQELIYYMIEVLCRADRDHQLILTTHSPFILFAINNCMMGSLVRRNIPSEAAVDIPSYPAWINPALVSIYEIHDGSIKCIQDEDGIITDNYLNQAYKENSSEYLTMLDYFDNEE
ncbi:MAG: ATP-binding protein [Muribaculaceae bacterium]|nr:ATP-binding protein [Muribaculaceae bacterium]